MASVKPRQKPTKKSVLALDKIYNGDCLKLMRKLKSESVDLVIADPPFNIDYGYDEYNDRKSDEAYLNWCLEWIGEIHRILKPNGTFWLAISRGAKNYRAA